MYLSIYSDYFVSNDTIGLYMNNDLERIWKEAVVAKRNEAYYPDMTGVRSQAEAKDFSSSLCGQTSCEAHPASCTMGTVGPVPGIKSGRGVNLTTHPHLVPMSRMSMRYTSSPTWCLHGVEGQLYFYSPDIFIEN
jgi:hypothetical protein